MEYQIFDQMVLCNDIEVQRMLPLVSFQRREQALRFKHTFGQFACLKSYLLLQELLGFSLAESTFFTSPHGKPYLADHPDIHFNISHCREAIAVAVDSNPIGIDVERFITPSSSLLNYCMNEKEEAQVLQSEHPDQTFAALWTQKEALVKLYGTGITNNLKSLLSLYDRTSISLRTTLHPSYALTIACKI